MRRWTLTAFLAAAALGAAWLAPRLVGVLPAAPRAVAPSPVETLAPAIEVPRRIIERAAPRENVVPAAPREPLIPELDAPAAPTPVPRDFWPDRVDCGMG